MSPAGRPATCAWWPTSTMQSEPNAASGCSPSLAPPTSPGSTACLGRCRAWTSWMCRRLCAEPDGGSIGFHRLQDLPARAPGLAVCRRLVHPRLGFLAGGHGAVAGHVVDVQVEALEQEIDECTYLGRLRVAAREHRVERVVAALPARQHALDLAALDQGLDHDVRADGQAFTTQQCPLERPGVVGHQHRIDLERARAGTVIEIPHVAAALAMLCEGQDPVP